MEAPPLVRTREVKEAVVRRDEAAQTLATLSTTHPATSPEVSAARDSLKQAQNALRGTVKAARDAHTTHLIQRVYDCRAGHDGKGMWAGLKALAGARKGNSGPTALKDPTGPGLLVSDQEICEVLADHYEKVSSTTSHYAGAAFDTQHRRTIEDTVRHFRSHQSFEDNGPDGLAEDITPTEVTAQALKLDNNKAPSPLDNVNNELLKYGGPSLHTALAALFNKQFTL